jgi:hypothetical protein
MISDDEIQQIIARLDVIVPREGATVIFSQCGGGPDESKVRANAQGYLRLGLELMKGAYAQAKDKENASLIAVDIGYLVDDRSDVMFDTFERAEIPEMLPRAPGGVSKMTLGFYAILIILLIFFAVVGMVTVKQWLPW